jgi:hypothetical protein
MAMAIYRAYFPTKLDHINSPPAFLSYNSDEEAIERAKQLAKGQDVELWEGTHSVTRLTPQLRALVFGTA